jgi:hypothetical protein
VYQINTTYCDTHSRTYTWLGGGRNKLHPLLQSLLLSVPVEGLSPPELRTIVSVRAACPIESLDKALKLHQRMERFGDEFTIRDILRHGRALASGRLSGAQVASTPWVTLTVCNPLDAYWFWLAG